MEGGGGGGGGGRDGDWECSSCRNRNYAFRSFCNRCKQPRLLVDNNTPSDSKWLPRIGDWICTGCTNNNYASREKCKKCGQPKEVAAMPAVAIPGAPLPTHPTYFSRAQGGVERLGNVGEADRYGFQPTSSWHLGGNSMSGFPFAAQNNQFPSVPNGNGWRNGDWMCVCGFHNYSSRAQCKKCNASTPIVTTSSLASAAVTALGIKRMASEEIPHWDNKRLNAGQQPYPGYESFPSHDGNQLNGMYPTIPNGSTGVPPNFQVNLQMMRAPVTPILLGKGAKQWRDGDWMCSNCNNHNYASRASCNRCKSQREALGQPLSVS